MGSGSSSQKNVENNSKSAQEKSVPNGGRRDSATARMVDAEIEKIAQVLQRASSQCPKEMEEQQGENTPEKEVVLESFHEDTQQENSPEEEPQKQELQKEESQKVDSRQDGDAEVSPVSEKDPDQSVPDAKTANEDSTKDSEDGNELVVENLKKVSGKVTGNGTVRSSMLAKSGE